MEIAYWIIILFTFIYEPIIGYYDFRKFQSDVQTKQGARICFYLNTIISLWIPTLIVLLLVAFTDLTFREIGLTFPTINTHTLGPVITFTVFGLALLYVLVILYYLIGYRYRSAIRNQLLQAAEKEADGFSEIFPTTEKEKRLWNLVSVTAAITEEIIYRGFLIKAFTTLFPHLSIGFILLIASFLFGLAHTYQGLIGVIRTTVVGIFFSLLYLGFGSIVPVILFHFLIDYFAKFYGNFRKEK